MSTWTPIGAIAPESLAAARRELHWAAQALSATADAHLAHAADDSHTNMRWQDGALVGRAEVSLRVASFELVVGDDVFALRGKTLDEALAWLGEVFGGPAITAREYDMPPRPARFDPPADHLAELARWLANAFLLVSELAATRPDAIEVALWPHHFDVGSIFLLDGDAKGRQIGFGVSMGDHFYEQPYLYVTPYPIPPKPSLPALASGGAWHRAGFTGAVLTATTIAAAGSTQHALASRFFKSAVEASLAIIPASR
jgi:hypothetical protein